MTDPELLERHEDWVEAIVNDIMESFIFSGAMPDDRRREAIRRIVKANAPAPPQDEAAELCREVRELRKERDEATKMFKIAQADLLDWENREAAVCPEDVGFEELIALLQAKLAAAESSHRLLVERQEKSEKGQK